MLDLGTLDGEAGPVASGAVRYGFGRRGLVVAGLVIAVGLVALALGRSTGGDGGGPESEAATSEASVEPEEAPGDEPVDDDNESVSGDTAADSADGGEPADGDEQDSVSAADWPPPSIKRAEGSGRPVLGQDSGHFLFASRSADVIRLDLDTGDTETYGTLARPIAAFGDEILMWSREGLVAAPADDATATPRVVYSRPVDGTLRSYLEALSVLDGDRLAFEFALFASGDVGPAKVLVDLSSGETNNIVVPPRSRSVGGLVSVPGGGTFDFVDGEFRPVFQGDVVAVGRRTLIGYQCLDPSECELTVVNRETGATGQAELPDVPLLTELFFVDPEDRFLLVIFDRPRLGELQAGAYVADGFLDALTADGPPRQTPTQFAVSPDGIWVASGGFNTVRFFNLETGEEHAVELPPSGVRLDSIEQVLFVPRPDVP